MGAAKVDRSSVACLSKVRLLVIAAGGRRRTDMIASCSWKLISWKLMKFAETVLELSERSRGNFPDAGIRQRERSGENDSSFVGVVTET